MEIEKSNKKMRGIKLPEELWKIIKIRSAEEDKTITDMVTYLITKGLEKQE